MVKDSKKVIYALYALLGVIVAVCAVFVLMPRKTDGIVAVITENGQEIMRVDLSQEQSFDIIDITEKPVYFEVKDNAIRFTDSDCPDKVCIHAGWQTHEFDTAACLPNGIVMTLTSE